MLTAAVASDTIVILTSCRNRVSLSRVISCQVAIRRWIGFFFFNDTATTEIYTLSLHDALPILYNKVRTFDYTLITVKEDFNKEYNVKTDDYKRKDLRSEEHTSELQSRQYLVCRLLLEKKQDAHQFVVLDAYRRRRLGHHRYTDQLS